MSLLTETLPYAGCCAKNEYESSTRLRVDVSEGCEVVLRKTATAASLQIIPNSSFSLHLTPYKLRYLQRSEITHPPTHTRKKKFSLCFVFLSTSGFYIDMSHFQWRGTVRFWKIEYLSYVNDDWNFIVITIHYLFPECRVLHILTTV